MSQRAALRGLGQLWLNIFIVFWPFLVFLVLEVAVGIVVYEISGNGIVISIARLFALHLLAGLLGSFVVHEMGHWAVLALSPSVREVAVERSIFRISLLPLGKISVGEACAAALAGPVSAVVFGGFFWLFARNLGIHYWYIVHMLFLLPLFGDGRALVYLCSKFRGSSQRTV